MEPGAPQLQTPPGRRQNEAVHSWGPMEDRGCTTEIHGYEEAESQIPAVPLSAAPPKAASKKLVLPCLLLLLSRFSRVRLCVTSQTAAHKAPPSLGFSRQEHWSGLPFPSPMHEVESERETGQCSLHIRDFGNLKELRKSRVWDSNESC